MLTALMHRHHQQCDDLFADAEAAAAAADWAGARDRMTAFRDELFAHLAAEEEVLFPAFETATGMSGGPTQMMRLEHAQMRDLVERMAAVLEQADGEMFAGAAGTLLILMQQHNMKEENILYPMCDRSLAGQADALGKVLRERLGSACLVTD